MEAPLSPTTTSMNALKSLVTQAFDHVGKTYQHAITQARDECYESDPLFLEVSYMILSMASCSPDHLRVVNAEGLGWSTRVGECLRELSLVKYGILGGDGDARPRELVSTFLSDFHEAKKAPGSAPSATSYWMGPVFVSLTRNLLSRSRFKAAICVAVAEGRAAGKGKFLGIVFSIRHFVMIRVTPNRVFHSKRHALWTKITIPKMIYHKTRLFHLARAHENSVNYGKPEDRDWVDRSWVDSADSNDNVWVERDDHGSDKPGFEMLTRFFLSAYSPSESPALRAPEGLAMDREFTVVNKLQGELDLLQSPDPDEIERKGRFPQLNRESVMDSRVRCIMVVRASSSSCTSSMLSVPVLWEPWANPLRVRTANQPV
ncbi:hypothetical protein B0I35DRAFT_445166 [Stachybotrys elegans]|uniref:Uncharacterized protein n=1 Tax=Stachybotrys elegans TaxID=80388 RepID=A0A8K0SI15_9HYPO|nr:hypothetical protein B0I35DRAFT_445166 [Stachybotrys elegans]